MNEEKRQGSRPNPAGRPAEGRSLRDLFEAARMDTRQSLIERQDAHDLIRNSERTVLHRLDLRHGWVRRNLLSSPIRIGVTLMTTSAFASLMAIAVSQFTGAPSTPVQKPPTQSPAIFAQPAPAQHAESRVAPLPATAIAVLRSSEPARPEQSPINFSTAKLADSDTLHAVELNPDQLARLGVELPDNGDIVVYYSNAKGKAKSWRFKTIGHLTQGKGYPHNSSISVEPLPYAITYPMGEALMYSRFSSDGETPDVLIGMTPVVSRKYTSLYAIRRGETPGANAYMGISTDASDSSEEGHRASRIITEVETNTPENGPTLIVRPGASPRINDDMPPPPPPMITRHDPRATGDTAWKPGARRVKVTSKVTILSDRTVSGGTMKFTADSLVSPGDGSLQLRGNVHGTVADSAVSIMVNGESELDGADNLEVSPNRRHIVVKRVMVDSTMAFGEVPGWPNPNDSLGATVKQFAAQTLHSDSVGFMPGVLSSPEMDSLMKSLGGIKVGVAIRADTGMAVKSTVAGISIPKFPIQIKARRGAPIAPDSEAQDFEHFYRKQSGDTTSWSSLIPIRVTNYNTPEHHTLIFWYERTPEVLNIVPRSAVEKADARPKNLEVSVYPNPTSGVTNVHYVVKNGEPVTINVVNLLGQKLIEGGTRQDQHGDLSLDLSSLEPGVYLLIATLQNGEKAVERVVVTK